jgi:hypothetical protein
MSALAINALVEKRTRLIAICHSFMHIGLKDFNGSERERLGFFAEVKHDIRSGDASGEEFLCHSGSSPSE